MSRKKAVLLTVFIAYTVMIFCVFWETADDVSEIMRLKHYQDEIASLTCYVQKKKWKGSKVTRLDVILNNKKHLNFRLPNKTCDEFNHLVTSTHGSEFRAYFTAGTLMQLSIGGIEVVNFLERRSAYRRGAIYAWSVPLIIYCFFVLHRRWYKNKYGYYPEEKSKMPKSTKSTNRTWI